MNLRRVEPVQTVIPLKPGRWRIEGWWALRDHDGKLIRPPEMYMNKCIHFTGFQKKVCCKGIRYGDVRIYMEGMPCFINCSYAAGECSEAEFMTFEEASDVYSKQLKRDEAIKNMVCPECGSELIDARLKEGTHKGHGAIVCPECRKPLVII